MRKLNYRKIRWIIKKKEEGMSSEEIAFLQKVSKRRVRQIYQQYRETGKIPTLKNQEEKRNIFQKSIKKLSIKLTENIILDRLHWKK